MRQNFLKVEIQQKLTVHIARVIAIVVVGVAVFVCPACVREPVVNLLSIQASRHAQF